MHRQITRQHSMSITTKRTTGMMQIKTRIQYPSIIFSFLLNRFRWKIKDKYHKVLVSHHNKQLRFRWDSFKHLKLTKIMSSTNTTTKRTTLLALITLLLCNNSSYFYSKCTSGSRVLVNLHQTCLQYKFSNRQQTQQSSTSTMMKKMIKNEW